MSSEKRPGALPVILAAFANDRVDGLRYLRNLPEELRRLRAALAGAAELCELVVIPNATLRELVDALQAYRDRVAVFHYGGHANSFQLLLESSQGSAHHVRGSGLASILGQQRGLQLVFLNGCSTEPQTEELLAAGVPCVIATTQVIDDQLATNLSARFYQGLANGASIEVAFAESVGEAKAAGNSGHRLLVSLDDEESAVTGGEGRFPWLLRIAPGAEQAGNWNLPTAANNPLFGLPPLPKQDLPESPYRSLQWFRREDAEVFFGRGREIRDLFQLVTEASTPPIVLFYGQSGVGKSSVLDAGLLPRLESMSEAAYVRRDATRGLSGTLREVFGEPRTQDLRDAWRQFEAERGRPLTVILDQVEEVFTRRSADAGDELRSFVELLAHVFANPVTRPRGRIVLGFRKEWFAEIEERLADVRLPRSKVFLERLSRWGVIDVVRGPVQSVRLRNQYRLSVEDGLAELIADDLLADPATPVAPTLQILLTRLWSEARRTRPEAPTLDAQLYQRLSRQGILLDDFLRQQLAALEQRLPQAVASGFLLDLLATHTTSLGTSAQLVEGELRQLYARQSHTGLLESVIGLCQDHYLLSVSMAGDGPLARTSLMHDTLAPLIRERHDKSDLPGQRARRILDNRVIGWGEGREGNTLDFVDLRIVEQGEEGTRAWTADEQRLVEASRQLRAKNQRLRRLWQVTGVVAVVALVITAGVAWWQKRQATHAENEARISEERAQRAAQDATASAVDARRQSALTFFNLGIAARRFEADVFKEANLFAAAGDTHDDPGFQDAMRMAARSALGGTRLERILEAGGAIHGHWELNSGESLIWSSSARVDSEPILALVGNDSHSRRPLLLGGTVLNDVRPRSDQKACVAVEWDRDEGGQRFHVIDLPRARTVAVISGPTASPEMAAQDATWTRHRFSTGGTRVVVWGKATAAVIDTLTGMAERIPISHPLDEAFVSPEGTRIVAISQQRVHVWRRNANSTWERDAVDLPMDETSRVTLLDERRLVHFNGAGQGYLLDVDSRERVNLGGQNWEADYAVFHQVDVENRRALAWNHQRVVIWNLESPRDAQGEIPGQHVEMNLEGPPAGVVCNSSGTRLAFWTPTRVTIGDTDPSRDAPRIDIDIADGTPYSGVQFAPGGRRILVWTSSWIVWPDRMVSNLSGATAAGHIHVYDAETGVLDAPVIRSRLSLQGARFAGGDGRVAVWGADGRTYVWEITGRATKRSVAGTANAVELDRLRWQALGGDAAALQQVNDDRESSVERNGKFVRLFGEVPEAAFSKLLQGNHWNGAVRRDSRSRRLIAWEGNSVVVADLNGVPLTVAGGEPCRWTQRAEVADVRLTPDGKRAVVRMDAAFQIWDVEQVRPLSGELGNVGLDGCVFSRDGSLLLEWGGSDGRQVSEVGGYARVWDLTQIRPVTRMLRHDLGVRLADFNADGTRIVTSTGYVNRIGTTTVHVWDVRLGIELVPPLVRPRSALSYAMFDPNGERVLAWGGSRTETLERWEWTSEYSPSAEPLAIAITRLTGTRLNRFSELEYLTRDEWERLRATPP